MEPILVIPTTVDQFNHLSQKLGGAPGQVTGKFSNHDVTFDWRYMQPDGITITLESRNSFLARHAPLDTIYSHIKAEILNLEA